MHNVHKYYSGPTENVKAVNGADLNISEGELVAIFGPSGSGKTTFLLLAAGLIEPERGSVSFQGKDLASFNSEEILAYRRGQLGFIFQSFNLIPGLSALDNVALPRLLAGVDYRQAKALAQETLGLVGLAKRVDHLPTRLSGGEQQRVAIARALVGRPSLILADEPTGNLDTARGQEVLALLTGLAREHNAAVVLVSHDIRAANYADRIQEMRDGRLHEYQAQEVSETVAESVVEW